MTKKNPHLFWSADSFSQHTSKRGPQLQNSVYLDRKPAAAIRELQANEGVVHRRGLQLVDRHTQVTKTCRHQRGALVDFLRTGTKNDEVVQVAPQRHRGAGAELHGVAPVTHQLCLWHLRVQQRRREKQLAKVWRPRPSHRQDP